MAQNQILRGNLSLSDSDRLRFLLIFDFRDPGTKGRRRATGSPSAAENGKPGISSTAKMKSLSSQIASRLPVCR